MTEAAGEFGVGKVVKGLLGFSVLRHLVFFLPRIGLPLFILYAVCLAWLALGPQKPKVGAERQRVADRAVEKAIGEIRAHRGALANVRMYHFANDPTDCLSLKFRDALDGTGILNLEGTPFLERLRLFANLRVPGCGSATEAVRAVRGAEVDGVLWGAIDRFESFGGGALLSGRYQLVEVPSGIVVYEGRLQENTITPENLSAAGVESFVYRVRWHIRFLCFVLVVLLLPVATITFIRAMVARRSNRTNALTLAVYTVVDLIAAFFMVGGAFDTFLQVLVFLIGGALAFGYNVYLMRFALRLEGD